MTPVVSLLLVQQGRGEHYYHQTAKLLYRNEPLESSRLSSAAMYIHLLHAAPPSACGLLSQSLPDHIMSELRAHPSSKLVLCPLLLPEPGTVEASTEAIARLHDLSLLQLYNDREVEMEQLVELVSNVYDSMGPLDCC